MTTSKKYTTDFVTSKDGTKIHYRQIGSGAGLILIHGGMMYSQNFMSLAELLANEFTVYIPDRRGRGLSVSHGDNQGLLAESEDIQAIINKTKAQNVFGLSSGAIIVLQTAIMEPALKKIAIYEPPIPSNGRNPLAWVDKYKIALSEENFGKAFISIIKKVDDPSSLLRILPSFITVPFFNFAIKADAKKIKADDEMSLKALISAMSYDIKIVMDSEGIIDKCKNLTTDILLLGGQKSLPYLTMALDALSSVLPQAKRTEFRGLGHTAADNGGKPEVVAKELRNFFWTTNNKYKQTTDTVQNGRNETNASS
jgi:pimeloyl-ACP methyl ester carboxylesterase